VFDGGGANEKQIGLKWGLWREGRKYKKRIFSKIHYGERMGEDL